VKKVVKCLIVWALLFCRCEVRGHQSVFGITIEIGKTNNIAKKTRSIFKKCERGSFKGLWAWQ